jgi:ankyrin repeat protein
MHFLFQNKKGRTPLVCAIERQNTELVKILLAAGAAVAGYRVQENDELDSTVPLIFVALTRDMPQDIVKAVCESGTQDLFEKNSVSSISSSEKGVYAYLLLRSL